MAGVIVFEFEVIFQGTEFPEAANIKKQTHNKKKPQTTYSKALIPRTVTILMWQVFGHSHTARINYLKTFCRSEINCRYHSA